MNPKLPEEHQTRSRTSNSLKNTKTAQELLTPSWTPNSTKTIELSFKEPKVANKPHTRSENPKPAEKHQTR